MPLTVTTNITKLYEPRHPLKRGICDTKAPTKINKCTARSYLGFEQSF